jgi:hypothetical protein
LKTKRGEEERGEREKKKKEGEREEKGRRGASKQPPPEYELCSFAKRCTRAWIVFIFLARFSYVGEAFLLFLPARKCIKMHAKADLRQEDGII